MIIYRVVTNREGQYSIWPVDKSVPAGWEETEKKGELQECLKHINEVWYDMRPLSIRAAKAKNNLRDESQAPQADVGEG
jgi:MbtH protein